MEVNGLAGHRKSRDNAARYNRYVLGRSSVGVNHFGGKRLWNSEADKKYDDTKTEKRAKDPNAKERYIDDDNTS